MDGYARVGVGVRGRLVVLFLFRERYDAAALCCAVLCCAGPVVTHAWGQIAIWEGVQVDCKANQLAATVVGQSLCIVPTVDTGGSERTVL